jgi:hypothetical protein
LSGWEAVDEAYPSVATTSSQRRPDRIAGQRHSAFRGERAAGAARCIVVSVPIELERAHQRGMRRSDLFQTIGQLALVLQPTQSGIQLGDAGAAELRDFRSRALATRHRHHFFACAVVARIEAHRGTLKTEAGGCANPPRLRTRCAL